nr:MAG TPA: hypothetical protein [Caudoviricetes sp.]
MSAFLLKTYKSSLLAIIFLHKKSRSKRQITDCIKTET